LYKLRALALLVLASLSACQAVPSASSTQANIPVTTAESEAAYGFALINPVNTRDQHFDGWNRLRNAGARGNVEALHWSAAHDFDTCKARFAPSGNYRKICADYYSTLVSAASRFCARGAEQDLRYSLPYRVAIEEQSRGFVASANQWHLVNLRYCAKAKEHYPKEVANAFSAIVSKDEESLKALTPTEFEIAKRAVDAAENELSESGIAQLSN
jgi:hypothetical protein